jgi:type IV secretory pathway VirB10-like protein
MQHHARPGSVTPSVRASRVEMNPMFMATDTLAKLRCLSQSRESAGQGPQRRLDDGAPRKYGYRDRTERADSNMKRLQLIFVAALAVATLAATGCSKKESEPPPPPSVTTTIQKPQPPPPLPAVVNPPPPEASATTPPVTDDEDAAQVKKLESDYQNTQDFQKRVVILYDLSSTESPGTIDAIARLFLNEKDQELKVELINSLMDIDGQKDKKLAILSSAVRGDQPKDVRLEAIDGMADVEDKRAIQILQLFANDPDEEIRDAVKDTIEQLQTVTTEPQPGP